MKPEIHKRTFEAAKHPKGSEMLQTLNGDTLTSEYSTGSPWLVRCPALMSDGRPNPVQRWHDSVFRTRREADIHAKAA